MNKIDDIVVAHNSPSGSVVSDGDVLLHLMSQIEKNPHISQRTLANELGVALGLLNSYLKSCVKKGWVRVNQVPAKRFAYFLTPEGVSEKGRMVGQYLRRNFEFFKTIKLESQELVDQFKIQGTLGVKIVGQSELSEIFTLVAETSGISITFIYDFQNINADDHIVIADLDHPQHVYDKIKKIVKPGHVHAFNAMHIRTGDVS